MQYLPLSDVLVASTGLDVEVLRVLDSCGVLVTRPPEAIFLLIEKSEVYKSRILTPRSVSSLIRVRLKDKVCATFP